MDLLTCWSNSDNLLRRVGLLFIALAIFQFSLAVGQKPVIFQYGWDGQDLKVPGAPNAVVAPIQNDEIICLGDFHSSNGSLLLTSVDSSTGSVSGRCVYKTFVHLIKTCANPISLSSFSTAFEVQITAGSKTSLQGLAFIIGSDSSTQGSGEGYLGWLNSTTNGDPSSPHNFGVEIDFFQDLKFQDPPDYHVGTDVNNLTSSNTTTIEGLRTWRSATEGNTEFTLHVWVEYDGSAHILDVFLSWSPGFDHDLQTISKPQHPILSTSIDLYDTLAKNGMCVGFSGSISDSVTSYDIRPWTFNSDGHAPDVPRKADGTPIDPRVGDSEKRKQEIITISVSTGVSALVLAALLFIITVLYRRNARLTALARKYKIEEGLLDRGPQNFKYKVLNTATRGFSTLLGTGGFGSVYKGSLVLKGDQKPTEIAVKRISATSKQGTQEFLAEVKIIGQVQHRNLVRLLGWCHERGELLLVYDYMPNGSLDQHLYKKIDDGSKEPLLTWSTRLKIVSGVARALAYLHDEWNQRVIHRDVKAPNVMLDRDFNARVGDFGLARLSAHDQAPPSTAVLAGTYGYLAPELGVTLKPTEKTDVYSFGAVVLEVATGKKPLLSKEDRESIDEILLVDWVWGLYRDDALLEAADSALRNAYDPGEMIMFLKIGLLCSHPNPDERPTMREVINIWTGSSLFPPLPSSKPVPVFASRMAFDNGWDTDSFTFTDSYGHGDVSDTQTSLTSDGHSTLTVASKDVGNTLPEQHEGQAGGSPHPTLRYRRTTTSLPF